MTSKEPQRTHVIRHLFEGWLAQHRMRFRHPPDRIREHREGGIEFHFAGVAPLLSCLIQPRGRLTPDSG